MEQEDVPQYSGNETVSTAMNWLGIICGVVAAVLSIFALYELGALLISDTREASAHGTFAGIFTFVFMFVLIAIALLLIAIGGVIGFVGGAAHWTVALVSVPAFGFLSWWSHGREGVLWVSLWTITVGTVIGSLIGAAMSLTRKFPNLARERRRALREEQLAAARTDRFGAYADWLHDNDILEARYAYRDDESRPDEFAFRCIGIPGENLPSGIGQGLDRKSVQQGIRGEIRTAEIIHALSRRHPGITLVNGIEVPDHGNADVDHILLYGNTAILIDSKLYSGSTYGWSEGGIVRFPPVDDSAPRRNFLATGRKYFDTVLPRNTDVHAMVLVHSTRDDDVIISGDPRPAGLPLLINAREGAERIDEILTDAVPMPSGSLRGAPAARQADLEASVEPLVPEWVTARNDRLSRQYWQSAAADGPDDSGPAGEEVIDVEVVEDN